MDHWWWKTTPQGQVYYDRGSGQPPDPALQNRPLHPSTHQVPF